MTQDNNTTSCPYEDSCPYSDPETYERPCEWLLLEECDMFLQAKEEFTKEKVYFPRKKYK